LTLSLNIKIEAASLRPQLGCFEIELESSYGSNK